MKKTVNLRRSEPPVLEDNESHSIQMKTVRWLNYISVDSCKSKVKWHSNKSLCLIVKVHTMSSLSSADWFAIRE